MNEEIGLPNCNAGTGNMSGIDRRGKTGLGLRPKKDAPSISGVS